MHNANFSFSENHRKSRINSTSIIVTYLDFTWFPRHFEISYVKFRPFSEISLSYLSLDDSYTQNEGLCRNNSSHSISQHWAIQQSSIFAQISLSHLEWLAYIHLYGMLNFRNYNVPDFGQWDINLLWCIPPAVSCGDGMMGGVVGWDVGGRGLRWVCVGGEGGADPGFTPHGRRVT